jgi:Papain family cysteine protease
VLRWHFVNAGRVGRDELLSPRFIWMASKETDQFITEPTTFIETEGTSLKAALDLARKFGEVRDSNTARGGHAVSIVGYKSDRFIIRNSWGTGWGDKGFGYASLADAQDAFTEACGVAV